MSSDVEFLKQAIDLAAESAAADGGPFGAIVVANAITVGVGTNRVVAHRDPTGHAEVNAIRSAAQQLQSHDLSGAVLYSSCEPCPMCLAACWWARLDRIVFSASRTQAAAAGFDDEAIYTEVSRPLDQRHLPTVQLCAADSERPFDAWRVNSSRVDY